MRDQITVETDLFEHKEVKPHFVNACCFGEDFAAWLIGALAPLTAAGFELSAPTQEDYGWGFWADHGSVSFWVALSHVGTGPTEEPARWVVSVNYDAGLNVIKRIFHRPSLHAFSQLRDQVWNGIKSNADIKVLEPGA